MRSFMKSVLQLHRTERPAPAVDGDIPRVLEELGPWQEVSHQADTAVTDAALR